MNSSKKKTESDARALCATLPGTEWEAVAQPFGDRFEAQARKPGLVIVSNGGTYRARLYPSIPCKSCYTEMLFEYESHDPILALTHVILDARTLMSHLRSIIDTTQQGD